MERSQRFLVAIATALLLASCGTTVPLGAQAGSSTDGDLSGDGLSAPPTGGVQVSPTGAASGPSTSASGDGGSVTAAPTGPASSSAGPSTSLVPGGQRVGPSGTAPGVTATTIKVGVYTVQGFGAFADAVGANVGIGDQQAQARAVIGYLNAHGGIAGRKVMPVFHDLNVAGAASDVSSEYQKACGHWTQDDRVYAVVSPIGTVNDTLYACLKKAGVPTVGAGDSQDTSFFERYADVFYQPTDMNLRRVLSTNADALAGAGFFGGKPKIGVMLANTPGDQAAVDKGLKPALARHGLAVTDSFVVPTGAGGYVSSAYSNAVLRFRANGITHILFTQLADPVTFMTNAENQGYRPRYGLHSRNSPATVMQGNAPREQQRGAMGVGWQPMNDVDGAHDPGVLNPRQALCLKLMKDAGQDITVRATALIALWICDNFLFLHDALQKAPTFALSGLRTGAEALGTVPAASTFRSTFAPGRTHDGAGAYRVFAFKDDCGCYQYVSPLRTAS